METPTFEFVVGNKPEQLKASKTRRLKSHLSKRGWQAHRAARDEQAAAAQLLSMTKTKSTIMSSTVTEITKADGNQGKEFRKRRRQKTRLTITFECVSEPEEQLQHRFKENGSIKHRYGVKAMDELPPIEYQLGGGRIDPFGAYPGQRRPYVPALVDHCKSSTNIK